MTDEELKALVASLSVNQKDLQKQFKETDKQIKETSKQLKETDKQLKETDRKLEKIAKMVGGIANNNGDFAEEYFYSALRANPQINGMKFQAVYRNLSGSIKNIQDEFDIVAVNGKELILCEVKYKFHPDDVAKLKDNKIPNFKILFAALCKNLKIYGAVCALSMSEKTVKEAKHYGFFALSQHQNKLAILNHKVTAY